MKTAAEDTHSFRVALERRLKGNQLRASSRRFHQDIDAAIGNGCVS